MGGNGEARVLLDGEPVSGDAAGEDVEGGAINVDKPRMYRLVKGVDVERHTLTVETQSDGLAAFAFTFTSLRRAAAARVGEHGLRGPGAVRHNLVRCYAACRPAASAGL